MQDSLVQAIQKRIFSGELEPGQRILEEDLAVSVGVSRATIREALRQMEQLGLVRIRPRRGTFVTQLSLRQVERSCRLRALLEGLAARYASERLEETDLARLRGCVENMKAAADTEDFDEFLRYDMEFHHRVWKLADDRQLEYILRYLSSPYFAFVARVSTYIYSDVRAILRAHHQYVKILGCSNPDEVQTTVQRMHEALAQHLLHEVRKNNAKIPHLISEQEED